MNKYKELNITLISDTHTKHNQVTKDLPGGDIIIHSGDISNMGYFAEIVDFLIWYNSLPYRYKVFIAGNHDFGFQDYPEKIKEILAEYPDVIYLENSSVEIEGLKIWGSPYTPRFFDWAFNVNRGELDVHWNLIPKGTDIVVTHGPPNGYLDDVPLNPLYNVGTHCGCEQLIKKIEEVKPRLHVFGHIHHTSGKTKNKWTRFINASVLNDRYMYTNKPKRVKLKVKTI